MPPGIGALAKRLSRYIDDASLLRLALAHRSYCAEFPAQESNERLEFLGDAILGLIVTDDLYRSHPLYSEGDLAQIRSAVVNADTLAPLARSLGIGDALLLGRGEMRSGGRNKSSLLANALEALIGAAYLARGIEGATAFVRDVFGDEIERAASQAVLGDAKNHLQELASKLGFDLPRYVVTEQGPDHEKLFHAEVELAGVSGTGVGRSKKQAERRAAQSALAALEAKDLENSERNDA